MARVDAGPAALGGTTLFRAALGVLLALVAVIAAVQVSEWLSRPDVFPVRAMRFQAEFRNVSREQLAAAVAEAVRGNFLQLDLDVVKARAESLPWVYQAEVRRRWPRDLVIRIHEQQWVARWNDDAWVNDAMQAVRVQGGELPTDVPQLAGPEGAQALVYERFHAFGRLLAYADLRIRRLTLSARRTWRIELTNGLRLVLGRAQPDKKLERFARAYARTLAPQAAMIRTVDLRYTNGFAVETARGRAVGARGPESGDAPNIQGAPRADQAQEG